MPIYEYRCSKCEGITEILQKFDDPMPSRCESCGAEASLSKLISQSSFHLKGTGWYVTDFKNKAQQKAAPKSESADQAKLSQNEPGQSESRQPESGQVEAGQSERKPEPSAKESKDSTVSSESKPGNDSAKST